MLHVLSIEMRQISQGALALNTLKIKTCTFAMQAQNNVLTRPWHKQMAHYWE